MTDVQFLVPDLPKLRSGGNLYNRHIASGLVQRGCRVLCQRVDLKAQKPSLVANHELTIIDGLISAKVTDIRSASSKILLCHGPKLPVIDSSHYDRIVFTSPTLREDFNAQFQSNQTPTHVIIPGIDHIKYLSHLSSDQKTMLTVGSLIPDKGYDFILPVLGCLKNRNWRYVVIGDQNANPSYLKKLHKMIADYNLVDSVRLLGSKDHCEIAQWLAKSDVYLSPAPYESFGIAIMEALSAGLPVINCSDGYPRQMIDQRCGWQFSHQSGPALIDFLENWASGTLELPQPIPPQLPSWDMQAQIWHHLIQEVKLSC